MNASPKKQQIFTVKRYDGTVTSVSMHTDFVQKLCTFTDGSMRKVRDAIRDAASKPPTELQAFEAFSSVVRERVYSQLRATSGIGGAQ